MYHSHKHMPKLRIDIWDIFTHPQYEFLQRLWHVVQPPQFLNKGILVGVGISGFDIETGIFEKVEKFTATHIDKNQVHLHLRDMRRVLHASGARG